MKTQLKKSLSLFLAVLMVLSCWVWIAPDKAEAADATNTKYTVGVTFTIINDNGKFSSGNISYKTLGDGWGTESGLKQGLDITNEVKTNNTYTKTFDTGTNFPTVVSVYATGGGKSGTSGSDARIEIKEITINGVSVWSGNVGFNKSNTQEFYPTLTNDDGNKGTAGNVGGTWNWARPHIVGFTNKAGTMKDISLNEINSAAVEEAPTLSVAGGTYVNQYGVKWSGSYDANKSWMESGTPYISTKQYSDEEYTKASDYLYYDSDKGKVVAKPDLQVDDAKANGTLSAYVTQKFTYKTSDSTITSYISAPFTITYPTYTVSVNGAGSISGLKYTIGLTNGGTKSDTWSLTNYYGTTMTDMPNGTGDATGYTFKGFWTVKQPSGSEAASYNSLESAFAEPISDEKFKEYKNDGGVVNGEYITHNDTLYYNAGTQWSTSNKQIQGHKTYYGWWLSKDVTIKLYDIDGKFLGSIPVKYGQENSKIAWPTPTESYTSGAFTYNNFTGKWVDVNGEVISQTSGTVTRDLILTPKYDAVAFDNSYTVNFIGTGGSALSGSGDYSYRTDLSSPNVIPGDQAVPTTIKNDLQYSYTFEGWSTQKPSSGNYHILLEDGDFNEAGTAIYINSDWIVRDDVTYYPVYRRHLRSYVVKFWYKDSTGNEVSRNVTVKYGEALKAPIDYVPYTYAKEGYGYEFENWTYNTGAGTFGYDKTLAFTKENITFGLGAEDDGIDVTPVAISASYGNAIPTPYTVTFKYKNDKGEDVKSEIQVNHGANILENDVNQLSPAKEYDNGEAMVSFSGNWAVLDGAADKAEYATSEFTSFSPTSHITFEAIYGNPQPFYTVTYIDGGKTYSERILVGTNLPAWMEKIANDNGTPDNPDDDRVDEVEYTPAMANTTQGSYEFLGWYDEKQTDESYIVTNGNKYEKDWIVTGDITLYPQFKFTPYTYEIKFMNYDGTVQLAAGEYEYGQSLEIILTEANRAAQGRAQDDTYTYTFIGWDKTVPAFCEGHDVTFTAQYKPVYRYYEAKWYNSVLVDGKWIADKTTAENEDGETYETALLATTKHTYDSKLFNPAVSVECKEDAPDGQSYVFDGWYYNDAEGNAQPYVRGMKITAAMEFYAKYKLTNMLYTVKTDVDGVETEYKVASGNKATAIADPYSGYVDADKHNEFKGWYTTVDFAEGTKFDIANTEITADTTIYAKFEYSEHDFDGEELVTAPTYYAKGEKTVWCSCDAKLTAKTEEIDMLTDTVKPTGTIYLGKHGAWSSTGDAASASDNDPITIFANKNTDIIITVKDTGDVDALYNPSGNGKGIKNIKVFAFPADTVLTATNFGAAQSLAETIFEDDSEVLNCVANYTTKLGNMEVADLADDGSVQYNDNGSIKSKALEDGKAYIIYYTVFDKANNQLSTKVRTAKFYYDNTRPDFTVEGNNNAGKVIGTPTYCDKAVITGIEDGATLTVNNNPVDAADVTAGTYEITAAGNYFVTVTDKAGNETSKKFTVNDDHSYVVYEVLSTCTDDGYKTEKCIVCDHEKTREIYTSPGHIWSISVVAATCTENGYTYKLCAECGEDEKIYIVDGELVAPALGHDYVKIDGEIVYTVVTAPTCKTKGKEIATCKDCGETLTREIAIDENAHNWGASKTLKATCTETGKTYQSCKLCYTTRDIAVIPATGHENTEWVVTTSATCGTAGIETLKCKKCKADVDGDDEDTVADTREIPATGRHILAVSNDPTKTFDSTADMEGQITRYCTQCGQEWVEKVAKIEKYTVKFVDEDGTEIKTITDVVKGTTIEKTAVTEPTKANSADGKYKYTFATWKNEAGKSIALPFDVTADITLKASYAQSTIVYTHKFVVPNTWVSTLEDAKTYLEFATMMGAMGDSRVPVAEPSFALENAEEDAALKKIYTFKFLGWSTTGAKGDIVTDFTIKGDTTFYAVFEAVANKYQVIYYNGTEYVWDTTVDGGSTVTFGGEEPTKASDEKYHYTFNGWYDDATTKVPHKDDAKITSLTRLYAGFTAIEHVYDKTNGTVTQQQSCEAPELTEFTCACGAKTIEKTKDSLGGHVFNKEVVSEDGLTVRYYCKNDCGEYTESANTCTVTFKHNGVAIGIYTVAKGEKVKFDKAEPTKIADSRYSYTFDGWTTVVDGDKVYDKYAEIVASNNITLYAYFAKTELTYRVTYVDLDNKTLQTQAGLKYDAEIPAFTGKTPTKKNDDTYHYEFKGWSHNAGDKVTGDTIITPVFTAILHTYEAVIVDPTCTTVGKSVNKCTADGCTAEQVLVTTLPALGHKEVVINEVLPELGKDGSKTYYCTVCENTRTVSIPQLAGVDIKIIVYEADGKTLAAESAIVTITNKADGTQVKTTTTAPDGSATFYVVTGSEWTYAITGETLPKGGYGGSVVADGNVLEVGKLETEPDTDEHECSCTCHKGTFWSIIFKLIHKMLKIFTGKISCCEDYERSY